MTDDETWVDGDHANTLNRFDVGDTRTTHVIVEAHGVSKDDDAVAGTLCTNAQGGQRTTDIAGAYVAETTTQPVASTLTRGGHPNSNAPGRRREDDENLVGHQMSVRRLTPVECERLMGLPDGWTAPEGVKAPDSKRYAACGDAIVTTVAFWIADRIRMIEEEEAS